MRPHRLSLTAFGSFPGTETVDFDALTEAGLFLIHGPTGAGKTTILDALCFALYGVVPGQRNSARSLRCDHAPAGTGPSVTLEVTIRGRSLRIRRSPAWQRPKLRGTGFTEEKAKVVVEERRGAAWQGLTTRLDEAGDLVGGLLGMNAEQFCQVVMLPQGDFAKFLRADGDDRARLLERLFTVKVFTEAEAWLAERRRATGREEQELGREVAFAVERLEEAAGPLLASASDGGPAAGPLLASASDGGPAAGPALASASDGGAVAGPVLASASPGPSAPDGGAGDGGLPSAADDPLGWAGALLDAARAVVQRCEERHAAAGDAVRAARSRFEQAAALAERRRRHAEALTLRRTLDERADERADLQAVIDDAARADRVLPLITAARQRAEAAAKARAMVADALARARPLLTRRPAQSVEGPSGGAEPAGGAEPSVEELEGLERERRAELARLSELLTEEARLSVVRRDLSRVQQELAELVSADETVAARLAVLPGLVAEAEGRLADARVAAARIPAAQAVRDAAADLIDVDRELAALAGELEALAQREAEVAAAEAELPARLAAAGAALAEVRAEAAAVPAAAARLDAARSVLEAAHRRDALAAELESAAAAHQVLVDRAQETRERWLDLRQARIDGMAAELARDLTDGRPCAVCGSEHHPVPAAPAPSAPSPDDEHAAETAHEAAAADREAAERALASIESRLADASAATEGLSADTAAGRVLAAEEELARLRSVADREPALADALDRLEGERDHVRDRAREIAEALAAHHAHRTRLTAERTRLHTRLTQTLHPETLHPETLHPETLHPETVHAETVHAETVHAETVHAETVHAETVHAETLHAERPLAADASRGTPGELDGRRVLAAAEEEVRRLAAVAAREAGLAAEVAALGRERAELEERGRRIAARVAAGRTRHEELSADAGRLGARLDAARGGDPTLTARLSRLNDEAELLREALEATRAAVAAAAELDAAAGAAERAAAEAGFADVREAEEAYRSPAEREGKAELLRRLDDQHAAVTALLADPELIAAAAEPAPDLAAAEADRDAAEEAHTRLASERDRAAARAARLAELRDELAARIERWRPAAERHRLAERMAALASGTSGDNQWNMSLTSFVLGERLRQVVDAANERLDHMSSGRYLLRHDLRKTAGSRARSGGGLGLKVADAWTGVDRDPATLSGGESFITSLALALGLADVVTAEAGGAEVGTLFVDEGFGTLDEDTLDDVLDILDGLRDGGRAVGIVSHVGELRTRIPVQLKVGKTRRGSTLVS
ncbi:AAA family ATPase [Nonomuraea sp. NPDC001831]|uniref:AAA family ATPase n=1 Tax=Nonomuraea sp. NPDC001831 TaxID=3364340 RepID=UPI0036D0EDF5